MKEITLTVQVSIPVSMTYDEELPGFRKLREDALQAFRQHPAIAGPSWKMDLSDFVDSIGNGDMDLTCSCNACGGNGWLLADNSDHGKRIERCDSCKDFPSDSAAVQHVADLASGGKYLG